jgi:hypothetical protein
MDDASVRMSLAEEPEAEHEQDQPGISLPFSDHLRPAP